jgi:hypothetical protein
MKRPSFQFYPGDWLHDTGLRACSLGARGLWIDMLCYMHQGAPYGHLTLSKDGIKDGTKDIVRPILPPILARMVGSGVEEVERHLDELESAGVFSRTADGVIFSRRMVEDEKLRETRASGGSESLKNPKVPRPKLRKNELKDGDKDSFEGSSGISLRGSPSSSSSSSSSNLKTIEEGRTFNPTEVAHILCQKNGWSGKQMIWAIQEAIDFQAKRTPEVELEQVGEALVAAYARHKSEKGKFAVGPQKFFEQGLYCPASDRREAKNSVLTDNPATRALAQMEAS